MKKQFKKFIYALKLQTAKFVAFINTVCQYLDCMVDTLIDRFINCRYREGDICIFKYCPLYPLTLKPIVFFPQHQIADHQLRKPVPSIDMGYIKNIGQHQYE